MPVGPHDGPRPDEEPRPESARPGAAGDDGPQEVGPPGTPEPGHDEGDGEPADDGGTPDRPVPDHGVAADPADGATPGPAVDRSPDQTPGPAAVDVEAEWRQIVERLGDLDRSGGPPPADEPEEPDDLAPPTRRVVGPGGPGSDPRAWAPDPAVEEAEGHFVPPDPGPVLGGDPLLTMAWCAVLGVPALVVLSVVVGARLPGLVLQIGAGVFLAGLGVLLWRMPRGGDADDVDRGPGAVV